jgi:hypothetical protein
MSDVHTALIKGFAAASFGFVVLCAWADAAPAGAERVMAVGCRIEVKAVGEAIRINALAKSGMDTSGRYRFDIQKSSASGASRNTQSGEFSLEADKEEVLTTTFMDGSASGYRAKLAIESSFGSASCVSP